MVRVTRLTSVERTHEARAARRSPSDFDDRSPCTRGGEQTSKVLGIVADDIRVMPSRRHSHRGVDDVLGASFAKQETGGVGSRFVE
jgi:hypothetical protein